MLESEEILLGKLISLIYLMRDCIKSTTISNQHAHGAKKQKQKRLPQE